MKTKQTLIYGLCTVMLAFIVTACPETTGIGSGPVGPIEPVGPSFNITYHAVQIGGQPGVDSTGIEFNFSSSVNSLNLTAADITVGGVAEKNDAAVLTGSGTRLTLSPITVNSAGMAMVQITKPGIEAETKNFPVFKAEEIAPVLTGITADFDPGEAVFYTFTLRDSLKEHLTVTAYYDNGSNRVLEPEEYGLSGALTVGTSVITVSYIAGDITVTGKFTVTVSHIQLVSIAAEFDQGTAVIYPSTLLYSLKQYLTVTAYYNDGSVSTLGEYEYTLSGTLTAGTPTVTVTYGSQTETFTPTVTAVQLTSITARQYFFGPVIYPSTPLDSLKQYLTVTAYYNDGSEKVLLRGEYTLSGTLTAGASTVTVTYGGQTGTVTLTVTAVQLASITANYTGGSVEINSNIDSLKNNVTVTAYYNDLSERTLNAGDYSLSGNLSSIGQKTITVSCIEDGVTRTGTFSVTVVCTSHDYRWVETTAPSFIEEGVETEICSRCAYKGETRISAPSLPITATQEWNSALTMLNGKTGNYTLKIGGDIGVGGTAAASFGATAADSALIVTLKGSGKLYLTSNGSIIHIGNNQTLIIDGDDLILQGRRQGQNGSNTNNNASLVYVSGIYNNNVENTKLELRNGTITGNTFEPTSPGFGVGSYHSYGGGVYVSYGNFIMSGGTISGNTADPFASVPIGSGHGNSYGGGVYVANGNFTMSGGTIIDNTAAVSSSGDTWSNGGGVYVDDGNFMMTGGTISDNTASAINYNSLGGAYNIDNNGGGVFVYGTFTMTGGTISGNTAKSYSSSSSFGSRSFGGGVSAGTFTMTGGTISGNTVTTSTDGSGSYGGGVSVGTFTMTGGEIFGNTTVANSNSGSRGGGVNAGTFTMIGGTIYGNTVSGGRPNPSYSSSCGGGVYIDGGTFRIVTGTVYGSDEGALSNTANNYGAALAGSAQYGTFSIPGDFTSTWNSNGSLSSTDDTIRVVNGVLQ